MSGSKKSSLGQDDGDRSQERWKGYEERCGDVERQDGEKQREEKRKRVRREGMSSQPEQSVPLSQESQHSGKAGTHQVGRTRVRET